jgi:2-polyprenyl-6-methoxyphenol hydroxylase-like FAD-dependent oxidoreductase
VSSTYDAIVAGGGLAGSALGAALATSGARVLIVERETQFKDRVRGELVAPWGTAEAHRLGILDCLRAGDGHELPYIDFYNGPQLGVHRDMVATTPHRLPCISFFHPAMQERCLNRAQEAGCEVRRGARARSVEGGSSPALLIEQDGRAQEARARLIVIADGRVSELRRGAGFTVQRDPEELYVAGVLLGGVTALAEDTTIIIFNPPQGAAYLIPQGGGRARAYLAYHRAAPFRVSGAADFSKFVAESARIGAREDWFAGTVVSGPLASFSSADSWVAHPYQSGIALLGDAAGSNDPIWGQGLSLTLRDARVLRDCLLGSEDWDAAGHQYAAERDRYYGATHTVTRWLAQLNFERGQAADARRARALPLLALEPDRMPDHLNSGPDLPINEVVRSRYFGEQ